MSGYVYYYVNGIILIYDMYIIGMNVCNIWVYKILYYYFNFVYWCFVFGEYIGK